MEVFKELISQDSYLAKREGLKSLLWLLRNRDHHKEFNDYFISEKEHLKFTMKLLYDESVKIQTEAFLILWVFLESPSDKRGVRVNSTLLKNRDNLIKYAKDFLQGGREEDVYLQDKTEAVIKYLKRL